MDDMTPSRTRFEERAPRVRQDRRAAGGFGGRGPRRGGRRSQERRRPGRLGAGSEREPSTASRPSSARGGPDPSSGPSLGAAAVGRRARASVARSTSPNGASPSSPLQARRPVRAQVPARPPPQARARRPPRSSSRAGGSGRSPFCNESSDPTTLFVTEEGETGMGRQCGTVTPNVVPPETTMTVTFLLPPKSVTDCWIWVNPAPGKGGLVLPDVRRALKGEFSSRTGNDLGRP